MPEGVLLAYGAGKVFAYACVCYAGLLLVARRDRALVPLAAGLGLLRAAMGLGFGLLIFLASAWVYLAADGGFGGQLLAYLTVYVPTRWLEWSLIALLAIPAARTWRAFWLGADGRDRLWRVAAIAVSCLADIPVWLVAGGLPVGRFMC
jgi:hypothetical protein